jgi:hypothetical protein
MRTNLLKTNPTSENEMVYEFLKMEASSERWAESINSVLRDMNVKPEIITRGNLKSEKENAIRAEILSQFRGYKRNAEIFGNFPQNTNWTWAVFGKEDLQKIMYIDYSYWNEISNNTGSPTEAAKTILSGKTIFDVPNDGFINAAQKIKNGNIFPPMIFLTDETARKFIILEGHLRMTAFALVPEMFENVSVLLGICSSAELNKWYGKMP